jgi:hypothetical protein
MEAEKPNEGYKASLINSLPPHKSDTVLLLSKPVDSYYFFLTAIE